VGAIDYDRGHFNIGIYLINSFIFLCCSNII